MVYVIHKEYTIYLIGIIRIYDKYIYSNHMFDIFKGNSSNNMLKEQNIKTDTFVQ